MNKIVIIFVLFATLASVSLRASYADNTLFSAYSNDATGSITGMGAFTGNIWGLYSGYTHARGHNFSDCFVD